MRALTAPLALLACSLAGGAYAACEQPPLVMIPAQEDVSGNEQRILEDTQQYFQSMQEYVNCIRLELESAGDDASELYRNVLVQRNNNAVAEAEAVQRWFDSRFPDAATVEAPPNED